MHFNYKTKLFLNSPRIINSPQLMVLLKVVIGLGKIDFFGNLVERNGPYINQYSLYMGGFYVFSAFDLSFTVVLLKVVIGLGKIDFLAL